MLIKIIKIRIGNIKSYHKVAFGSRNLSDIPGNVLRECYIPMFGSDFRKIFLGMFRFPGMILSQYSPKTFPWGEVGILHSHDMGMF